MQTLRVRGEGEGRAGISSRERPYYLGTKDTRGDKQRIG
jgi:hypothetical protein